MYYYIYDSFLNEKKYFHALAKIETRLTDLGINGKINRLSFLKNLNQILSEEVKRGVKTIVIVGNDKTIGQAINLMVDLNVVIGIIPIGQPLNLPKILGIPEEERACDVLSARIVKNFDLGKINNYYFISSVEMVGQNISLECDNNYFINLMEKNNYINISNLNSIDGLITQPNDGQLDLFIKNKKKLFFGKNKTDLTRLSSREIKITSKKSLPIILIDEGRIIKTPAEIKIIPQKIKIIVGKNRQF